MKRLTDIVELLLKASFRKSVQQQYGIPSHFGFRTTFNVLMSKFSQAPNFETDPGFVSRVMKESGSSQKTVQQSLKYLQLLVRQCNTKQIKNILQLQEIANLYYPQKQFPLARKIKRKVIYHFGPTNSGKTQAAFNRLLKSDKGIYLAPLRLLAWQIYQKLNLRGQESKLNLQARHISCTVQLCNPTSQYDVAVIDQIQMIGDKQRGWAWTRALLCLQANQIHLCGDSRALNLIKKLVESCQDQFQICQYSRLSQLTLSDKLYQTSTDIQGGDCLIDFSMRSLLSQRKDVLKICQGKKPSIIFGKLPPQVKKLQANRFNQGVSNCILATNAIGMGLNLKINRIVFQTLEKLNNQGEKSRITNSQIRQIAGRAGRGTQDGMVFCRNEQDLAIVRQALNEIKVKSPQQNQLTIGPLNRQLRPHQCQIQKAGLFCSFQHLQRFSSALNKIYGESIPISQIFKVFLGVSALRSDFQFQRVQTFTKIAQQIDHLPLQLKDAFNFCVTPINITKGKNQYFNHFIGFAQNLAMAGQVRMPSNLVQVIQMQVKRPSSNDLVKYLDIYNLLQAYFWLGSKYNQAMVDVGKVEGWKASLCKKIQVALDLL